MNHKRFVYRCPMCEETGLQKDTKAVYKVRVCDVCAGRGRARITAAKRIELDHQLRGGKSKCLTIVSMSFTRTWMCVFSAESSRSTYVRSGTRCWSLRLRHAECRRLIRMGRAMSQR